MALWLIYESEIKFEEFIATFLDELKTSVSGSTLAGRFSSLSMKAN